MTLFRKTVRQMVYRCTHILAMDCQAEEQRGALSRGFHRAENPQLSIRGQHRDFDKKEDSWLF